MIKMIMRRNLLSYIPLLSFLEYGSSGWQMDRKQGLNSESINKKYNFHFNYMMLSFALGVFYFTAGFKYDVWNPLVQGTIIEHKVNNILEDILN